MRARKTVLALSCTLAVAGGIAACGTAEQLTAAQQIGNGFDKLGAAKSVKVGFRLDATPEQLVAVDGAAKDKLKIADAKKLSGLGATVTLSSATNVKDVLNALDDPKATALPAGAALAVEVHAGDGKPLLELREIGKTSYVKLGLDELVGLSGDPEMKAGIAEMRQGMSDMPAAYAAIKDLFNDKWVSVDSAELDKLAKDDAALGGLAGKAGKAPGAAPSLDAATRGKLVDAVAGVFTKDLTLTDKGSENGLEHIEVNAPARKLAIDLQAAVAPLLKKVPGLGDAMPSAAPTGLTEQKVSADVFLKDGALAKISMDVSRLDAEAPAGAKVPVSLSFALDAPAVAAPSGASVIGSGVLQDMLQGMGSMSDEATGEGPSLDGLGG